MSEIINNREVKRALEKKICPTHQEHPTIKETSKGLSFTACCESFKETLVEEAKQLYTKQARQNISDQLRDLFG